MAEQYELVNGYDSKAGVNSGSLEAGTGDKTVIYEDRDSKVYVDANDLTAGSGLKTLMDNGWDAKVVVFATDLVAGSGQKTVMVNGYDSLVIFNPEEEGTGDGDKTKLVNGYDATAVFGLAAAAPPNYDELIQYLTGETEERDGNTYLIDSIGDNVRDPLPGVYTDTGAITQLQFDDLTGLAIDTYQGNGTATISGNNVNITGTEFSSIKFDDGSYYSLEFLDGTTIKGEQSCTVVGTYTTDTTLSYLSYRDLSGYNKKEVFSLTYLTAFIVSGESIPLGINFSSDGLIMWICGRIGDNVRQYYLSTAWDMSTAVLDYTRSGFNNCNGMAWSADGLKGSVIMSSTSNDYIEFSVSTPFDIGSSYSVVRTLTLTEIVTGYDIQFNLDGTKMFVSTASIIWEWDLSTPYNATTRTEANQFDVTDNVISARGMAFNSDGTELLVAQNSPAAIMRYRLSTAFDTKTATYVDESSVLFTAGGVYWRESNNKVYCASDTGDRVSEYVYPIGFTPADITDNTIDTDGNAIPEAQQGRIRLDVLLDGTLRTELEASELYIMSQNLTTNILFTGETATAYEEALLEYNQDGAGVMFANITDYPTIGECLKYGVAQTGLLTDEDLHNALDYVDALEVVKDSEGVTVTYSDNTPMTVIKTGVLV